jgi:hypothetical protein
MPLVAISVITGTNEDWIDSIKFVVDDGSTTVPEDLPQLDLTGIRFDMEVRRQPPEAEVIIRASTVDGGLAVGETPNYGFILINIDHEFMKNIVPGTFVGDIVGTDAGTIRRVILIDLEVQYGITRP